MDSLADSLTQDPAHDHQQPRPPWLRSVADELRVHATVGADLHLALDQLSTSPAPISSYRQQFIDLLTDVLSEAAARLRGLKKITAAQAATWRALPGRAVIWRGAAELPTQPVAELAEATIALIDGTLAALLDGSPPPGHAAHWLTWRRRHQALARWYHHCTRLARNANVAWSQVNGRCLTWWCDVAPPNPRNSVGSPPSSYLVPRIRCSWERGGCSTSI